MYTHRTLEVQGVLSRFKVSCRFKGHMYTQARYMYTQARACVYMYRACVIIYPLNLQDTSLTSSLCIHVYIVYIYSSMYIIDTLAYVIRKLCLQYIYTILRSGRGVWEGSVCVYIYYMYVCVLFTCTHYIQAPVYNMCIYK
jgi:hypothetical protein